MLPFKLITFDITGTLLKLRRPVGELYAHEAVLFGITADPKEVGDNFKSYWEKLNKKYPNFGKESELSWEDWWKRLVRDTFFKSCRGRFSEEQIEGLSCHLIDLFATKRGWALTDGAGDLLDQLKLADVTVGAVSNFDPRLHSILDDFKISKQFNYVLTSYETGLVKPNLGIFKQVELLYEREFKQKPDLKRTLHVGNDYERDYKGAKAAGWNAALISDDIAKPVKESDMLVFRNLVEFRKFLFDKSYLIS